jgi:hypothetical protein
MEAFAKFQLVQNHKHKASQFAIEAKNATDSKVKDAYETIASLHLSTFQTLTVEFNQYASTTIGTIQNPQPE